MDIKSALPNIMLDIVSHLNRTGARCVLVGGAVRDYMLGLPLNDFDVEVYGLDDISALQEILSVFGPVILVGKSFGVLKLSVGNYKFDFSFPRTELKTKWGHTGFDVFFHMTRVS